MNVRHNQDNQRDFEERAAAQMIALLTKRTVTENLLSKFNNKQYGCKIKQPIGTFLMYYDCIYQSNQENTQIFIHTYIIHKYMSETGGTYIKLEAEFRERLAQSYKYKNPLIGKTRIKSNKS